MPCKQKSKTKKKGLIKVYCAHTEAVRATDYRILSRIEWCPLYANEAIFQSNNFIKHRGNMYLLCI